MSCRVKSSRVESTRDKSSQVESIRVESSRVKSSQVESSRVKSSQVESSQGKKTKSNQTKHLPDSPQKDFTFAISVAGRTQGEETLPLTITKFHKDTNSTIQALKSHHKKNSLNSDTIPGFTKVPNFQ